MYLQSSGYISCVCVLSVVYAYVTCAGSEFRYMHKGHK